MVMVVMFVFLRFRFHSGGLGVGGVFARRCLCLHNRPHLRNRPCEDHMTVPMVTFGGKRRVASFRVAGVGVAFCDIPTCFIHDVSKAVFVWQAQYFCKVIRRWPAFFLASAALWTCPSSFCVAGAALQTCRVACFFANCIVSVKWWQHANCMAGV